MEVYEDTGVTFGNSKVTSAPELGRSLVRRARGGGIFGLLGLASIIVFIAAANSEGFNARALAVLGGLLFLGWIFAVWQVARANRAGAQLGKLFEQRLLGGRPLTSQEMEELQSAWQHKLITENDRSFQSRRAYLSLLHKIVEDRHVGEDELALVRQVEKMFKLDGEFCAEARADAFRDAYLEVIVDNVLTAEEEASLDAVRQALSIPKSAVELEMEVVEHFREVRLIREGQMPTVSASVSLQESEMCYYEGPARVLKENNLRTYQQDGQKVKVRGLKVSDEGTLLLTNKRVLVVHQGTTTVKYNKILDLDVDYDRNLLIITKDGAKSPMLISTPNAMKAGAIIASVADL